jgi:hypothetical protein
MSNNEQPKTEREELAEAIQELKDAMVINLEPYVKAINDQLTIVLDKIKRIMQERGK